MKVKPLVLTTLERELATEKGKTPQDAERIRRIEQDIAVATEAVEQAEGGITA